MIGVQDAYYSGLLQVKSSKVQPTGETNFMFRQKFIPEADGKCNIGAKTDRDHYHYSNGDTSSLWPSLSPL